MIKAQQSKLAHELTIKECENHNNAWQILDKDGNSSYTEVAQEIFNGYYDLIEAIAGESKEDYEMLAEENKNFAKTLKKLGYTDEQISDIANT